MILAASAFAVFEGWALLLMAEDFKLRDIQRGHPNARISRCRQHHAHASNTTKRGATEDWMGQQPPCDK